MNETKMALMTETLRLTREGRLAEAVALLRQGRDPVDRPAPASAPVVEALPFTQPGPLHTDLPLPRSPALLARRSAASAARLGPPRHRSARPGTGAGRRSGHRAR